MPTGRRPASRFADHVANGAYFFSRVKITTAQGPMLVTFTQKVADLDVLLDPGDTVTLMIPGYATFVEDPVFERIKASGPAKAPA